jgi:hypothetical protein
MRESNQAEEVLAHADLRSESAFRAVAFGADAFVIQRVEVGFYIVPEGLREAWAGLDRRSTIFRPRNQNNRALPATIKRSR